MESQNIIPVVFRDMLVFVRTPHRGVLYGIRKDKERRNNKAFYVEYFNL